MPPLTESEKQKDKAKEIGPQNAEWQVAVGGRVSGLWGQASQVS